MAKYGHTTGIYSFRIRVYVKWLSGMLCYKYPSCKYWTWIENYKGWPHTCHLKNANPGLTNLEGVISGDKNCIAPPGKGADPIQCLSTFSEKSLRWEISGLRGVKISELFFTNKTVEHLR